MGKPQVFFSVSPEEVLSTLGSSRHGLSAAESIRRLTSVGPNSLPEPRRTAWWRLLLRQAKSFLILILLVAAGISYALHDRTDAVIILVAVVINVIVGFIQESKAEKSLQALRQVVSLRATVVRDQQSTDVDSSTLVPGDIICLRAGDRVPADARLLEQTKLATNEAALTGESVPISKQIEPAAADSGIGDQRCMVFFGTTVTDGSGVAVVIATGVRTEIGKIAALLHAAKDSATPLQKKLDRFAKNIAWIILAVSAILIAIGLLRQMPFVDIFVTAVAVAVSAIPEGLIVAVTIILAIGMQRILQRKALVRNLQAAETLGSTSVICTDKTGTITEGNMQVVAVVTNDYHFHELNGTPERYQDHGLQELMFAVTIGLLSNDATVVATDSGKQIVGNLTDRALLQVALQLGLNQTAIVAAEPRLATLPFDSTRKLMATLHQHPRLGQRIYTKGAPERILDLSYQVRVGNGVKVLSDATRQQFHDSFQEYLDQGLRILALAYKDVDPTDEISDEDITDLVFVGFVGISDPLRPGIADTFRRTEAAGITTVMITGDHVSTAKVIAEKVGIDLTTRRAIDGDELHELSQAQLNDQVEDIAVYARVSPEDKLNIINAWQSRGKVVAMTGDGVNDSPALKAADIGVALGSGTAVAKEAADMVLLDDSYETIVAAVEEGRGIFDNIRKVVLYLLSDSFSEVVLISLALLLGLPVPLTAAQILWSNLVGDGFPSVALAFDPKADDTMSRPPRDLRDPVMNKEMKVLVAAISLITGLGGLLVFWLYWTNTGDLVLARTVTFATLSLDSLIYIFSLRSLNHGLFHRDLWSNRWLIVAALFTFAIELLAIYFPPLQPFIGTTSLSWSHWGVALSVAVVVIVLIEIIKYIFIIKAKRRTT